MDRTEAECTTEFGFYRVQGPTATGDFGDFGVSFTDSVSGHGSFTHLKRNPNEGSRRGDIGSFIPVRGYLAVFLYRVKFHINDTVRAAMHEGKVYVAENSWCVLSPAYPS